MEETLKDVYPLGINTSIKGNRRILREKVLQLIISHAICETEPADLFEHIFYRQFNFGDEEPENNESNDESAPKRLLKPEELLDLEGDYPIIWKDEDVEFGKEVIQLFFDNSKSTDELLISVSDNWDISRIAKIDRVLIHIAVLEFLYFENIPTKVSINEALEIAKLYSTDKSNIFINGVLEKIKENLTKDNRITKTGRGLQSHSTPTT